MDWMALTIFTKDYTSTVVELCCHVAIHDEYLYVYTGRKYQYYYWASKCLVSRSSRAALLRTMTGCVVVVFGSY